VLQAAGALVPLLGFLGEQFHDDGRQDRWNGRQELGGGDGPFDVPALLAAVGRFCDPARTAPELDEKML
jgi:hypothetical protein